MQLDVVGTPEIAEMLGVSRQRVDALSRQVGFPEPAAKISLGRIWLRSDIEEWAHSIGRELR
jgi:predicted DNA-binding transcriptional regulator AlpA